ncbi:MAG: hypothetical protein RR928_14095 [Comamonas sp.]
MVEIKNVLGAIAWAFSGIAKAAGAQQALVSLRAAGGAQQALALASVDGWNAACGAAQQSSGPVALTACGILTSASQPSMPGLGRDRGS